MITPLQKTCIRCTNSFHILERDMNFYSEMELPHPTHCPYCRMQRRFTFRNDMTLYKRACSMTGRSIISVHPEDSLYTVYAIDVWWGDDWDPLSFGRDFDFSRPFFEQFAELEKAVPHFALFNDGSSENCEYTNYGVENKSCYMAGAAKCEDVYYGRSMLYSRTCVDGFVIMECELCYECVDCTKCYNLLFSDDCFQCSDSYFLKDCRNCKNCFGCVGLRNKEYMFFNEQLTKEEYEKRVSKFTSHMTHRKIKEAKLKLEELNLRVPHKCTHGTNNENVIGEYSNNCKNVFFGFDCIGLEQSSYCVLAGVQSFNVHDCINAGINCQNVYECVGVVGFNNCISICFGRYVQDSYYSQNCFNSSHLFGCFGLNRKQYCILNKQYTKEEYETLVPRIIEHMKKTPYKEKAPRQGVGVEWGEFFPAHISPYAYNETLAQEYFPLTKEQALAQGYRWKDLDSNENVKSDYEIPESIGEVDDEICKKTLVCEISGKPYRIIPQELKFYRRMGLPIPKRHHFQRHLDRLKRRNPYRLWQRNCDKCNAEIWTSYSEQRPEIVYCESCYKAEIY